MIAASTLHAGSDTLWSEDMQHGMTLAEDFRIINPFRHGKTNGARPWMESNLTFSTPHISVLRSFGLIEGRPQVAS
jgi:hypothetical protein